MNNQFAVQYNAEAAFKAGGGDFIQDGGAYVVEIICAKYVTAKTGSKGMEFEVKTESGQTAKFIKIYYEKTDGSVINGGYSTLCGIMHFLKLNGLSMQNAGDSSIAPELAGRKVGLFLQKSLYTKNDGAPGYSFEIRAPYNPVNMQTVREEQDQKPATAVNNWVNSYQDTDKRSAQPAAQQGGGDFSQQQGGYDNSFGDFNDDLPFGS
jgi:hypothetical protein